MRSINNQSILFLILIFFSWILNGCKSPEENAAKVAAQQAAQFAEKATTEIARAQDANASLKAAETTVKALKALTDAIIKTPDLSITVEAQDKFEVARFKTIRQLHRFIEPESNDCKPVLKMLLKLDSKVKDFACHQRGEADQLACHFNEVNQQCQCSRNSAGTCPNNKACTLLPDDTCQCNQC